MTKNPDRDGNDIEYLEDCDNDIDKRIEECEHSLRIRCHLQPERNDCIEEGERLLECGHKCMEKCRRPCNNSVPCRVPVKIHDQRGICGHNFIIVPCFQKADVINKEQLQNAVELCDEPCDALLKCGHRCRGTCSKCWQGRLHEQCQEACGNSSICGHSCKYPCREMCPPCEESCGFHCKHSRCVKKCGVPCVPCEEPCEWKCPHSKCTKKCGEICDKVPCQEACPELLDCGHPCVGYCGEPHPSCPKCHAEMNEIFLGYEDRKDAKFVLLEDCGHSLESEGLEKFLEIIPDGGAIMMKVCPKCRTPITRTQRCMNHVKKTYTYIQQVKLKIIFGADEETFERRREELYQKMLQFGTSSAMSIKATDLERIQNTVNQYVNEVDLARIDRNTISLAKLNTIEFFYLAIVDIESRLRDLCEEDEKKDIKVYIHEIVTDVVKFVNDLLRRIENLTIHQVSEQLSEDIALELQRYHKMVDLARVLQNPMYKQRKNDNVVGLLLQTLKDDIFRNERFDRIAKFKVNETFESLQKCLEALVPLTSQEKRIIKVAMIDDKGLWYTCSNGHYYIVTGCGGPMMRSICPECKEVIGGENAVLVSSSRRATDMG